MKRFVVAVIILILISGVGVFTALYTKIWNPSWNPFRPEPEEVISEMIEKMEDLNSVHRDFNLDLKGLEQEIWLSMKTASDINQEDEENLKEHSKLNINLTYNENIYSLGIENIVLGKKRYWKVVSLPDTSRLISFLISSFMVNIPGSQEGGLEKIGQLIKKEITNQWIEIDEERLKEMIGEAYSEKEMKVIQANQKKLEKRLSDVFKNPKLYKIRQVLPDTKIGDVKVYRYLLVVNKEGVRELIPDVLNNLIEFSSFSMAEQGTVSQEAKETFDKFDIPGLVDKFFDKLGDIEYEVWIGQRDKYLYKTRFVKKIELADLKDVMLQHFEEVASVTGGAPEEKEDELKNIREFLDKKFKGKVVVSGEINFSDFNKVGEINAPDDFMTIREFLNSLFQKILFGLMMRGRFDPSDMPFYNMPPGGAMPIP